MTTHRYRSSLSWEGSTRNYLEYDRNHSVTVGQTDMTLSADPAFLGDPARLNPEQLLVAAAASCQLLAFLAVAARSHVDVLSYRDEAEGEMPDDVTPTRITRIVLRPHVVVRGADEQKVLRLLHKGHDTCYIANSLTSEVLLDPTVEIVDGS